MKEKWELQNKIKLKNGIEAEYLKSKNAIILDKFELAIIFCSSESRALEYHKLLKNNLIQNSIFVMFNYPEKIKERKYNDILNIDYLKRVTKNKFKILKNLEIENIETNISKIINSIHQMELKSNQRWFIDITAPPLAYTVSLLGYCNNYFPSPKLSLLNVSGDYKIVKKHYCFTEGFREDINLPFFRGEFRWGSPILYIFLLGFEGHRSLNILVNNEPDFVTAMIASPGYQKNYEKEALDRNKVFLQRSHIEISDLLKADAGDPISTFKELQKVVTKYKKKNKRLNICYIPIGPKPHAIGSALSAIADEESTILYEIPFSYVLQEVPRNKYIYLYRINF